jgi:uncharacterized protein (TIGR03083 family)
MSLKELSLRCLHQDSVALAAAARSDPSARLPTCPDWTEHDIVHHVGRLHRWISHIASARVQERIWPSDLPSGPDDPAERLAWYEEGAAALVDALDAVDEDEPVWNWAEGVGPMRFWLRRVAAETALHRWDAQSGVGEPDPVDTELAVHGVDEMADVFLPVMREKVQRVAADGTTVHLHCTDAAGEWLLRFGAGGIETTREHAKGDVAVRGTASDLYLLLWNRVGAERCEVFGDASVLRRFAEVVRV